MPDLHLFKEEMRVGAFVLGVRAVVRWLLLR
jgi:hypothetical protein